MSRSFRTDPFHAIADAGVGRPAHKPTKLVTNRMLTSAREVISNAERLLDDARGLEFRKPPTSAWFLALIAQEELAKAFILCLSERRVLPWNQHLLRMLQDHKCKQLICVVMDYLAPDLDEFLARVNTVTVHRKLPVMPAKVADALNILRHEKIGRWMAGKWFWAENPCYDREAQEIADGKQDKRKQDALYVRLGGDGRVVSTPVKHAHAKLAAEMERADRFRSLLERLVAGVQNPALDWEDVRDAFKLLFTDLATQGKSGPTMRSS